MRTRSRKLHDQVDISRYGKCKHQLQSLGYNAILQNHCPALATTASRCVPYGGRPWKSSRHGAQAERLKATSPQSGVNGEMLGARTQSPGVHVLLYTKQVMQQAQPSQASWATGIYPSGVPADRNSFRSAGLCRSVSRVGGKVISSGPDGAVPW